MLNEAESAAEQGEVFEQEEQTDESSSFVYTGSGADSGKKKKKSKGGIKGKTASIIIILIVVLIIIVIVLFGSSSLPFQLDAQLIETQDVTYADTMNTNIAIFSEALKEGYVEPALARRMGESNCPVGTYSGGTFTETNTGSGLGVLIEDGDNSKFISQSNVASEIRSNSKLYEAFRQATYGRAANYYDDAALEVTDRYGTNRNTYTDGGTFQEIASENAKNAASVSAGAETEDEETGETTESTTTDVSGMIEEVKKTKSSSTDVATLTASSTLNAVDTATKEQKSVAFYLAFAEIISKVKAGEGNDTDIHNAMNYLYTAAESTSYDTETGQTVTTTKAPIDSDNLYAVLTDSEPSTSSADGYSSDRLISTTAKNDVALAYAGSLTGSVIKEAIKNTVASFGSKISTFFAKLFGGSSANGSALDKFSGILENSVNGDVSETLVGEAGGEALVEGAMKYGQALAVAGSGAAPSTSAAIAEYNEEIELYLALDAEVDRATLSPLDPTNKNTFLGSIVYKLSPVIATTLTSGTSSVSKLSSLGSTSLATVLGTSTYADSASKTLNNTYGNCATVTSIGAEGNVYCTALVTFDSSTVDKIFTSEYRNWVAAQTGTSSSSSIYELFKGTSNDEDKALGAYIAYNTKRVSPYGVTDTNLDDSTGEEFVNGGSSWGTYKYAQRFVAVARAVSQLTEFADDKTAYNFIPGFEDYDGTTTPVVAFLEDYYAENPEDETYLGYLSRLTGESKEALNAAFDWLDYRIYVASYDPSSAFDFTTSRDTLENPSDRISDLAFDINNRLQAAEKVEFSPLESRKYNGKLNNAVA